MIQQGLYRVIMKYRAIKFKKNLSRRKWCFEPIKASE
jgi:hypothetical protein